MGNDCRGLADGEGSVVPLRRLEPAALQGWAAAFALASH